MAKKNEVQPPVVEQVTKKYKNGHCPVCGSHDPVKNVDGSPLHMVMNNGAPGTITRTFLMYICNQCRSLYTAEVKCASHGGPQNLQRTPLMNKSGSENAPQRINHSHWTIKED